MSEYITFLLVGLGTGSAYAAIALGLVVTYKGTGIVNFAAGAMGAWGCYSYDELRTSGNLVLPLPINHRSVLGDDGHYGGVALVFFTLLSCGLFVVILRALVLAPLRRRFPARGVRIAGVVGGVAAVAWTALVFLRLRDDGVFYLPVVPHRYSVGSMAFGSAMVVALGVSAVVGLATHRLVFRPLRTAPPLAKVVASIGLMTTIQALIAFRFGSVPRTVGAVLPSDKLVVGDVSVPADRLFVAAAVIVVGVLLWTFFRYARTGLAIRAAAEDERAASLTGYAPDQLAGITWILSSVTMTTVLILTLQIIPLSPTVHTLMVVPALACALVGRLKYVGHTVAAGLLLGGLQSIMTFASSHSWWPVSLRTGLSDALPFAVLIVVLFVFGKSLPRRGSLLADPLPEVIIPRNRPGVIVPLVAGTLVVLLATSGGYRYGVISSMMFTLATLSVVVLTGLTGQISLSQAALAGTGGFALSKLTDDLGIGFPWSMLLAAAIATVFGVLVGIPAVRIRGPQLAVVTLAAAVALERFLFRNPSFTKPTGNPIPDPTLLGADLGVRSGDNIARWQFGAMVLVVVTLVVLAVSNIVRSSVGRRFIAVRSNERAGASIGINVAAHKLLAFGISSFIAGVAGSLIGYSRGQLSADSFATFVNVSFLAFAYLGGITGIAGAIVGGLFAPLGIGFVISNRLFDTGSVYTLLAGVGVIVTARFNPIGIAGAYRRKFATLGGRVRRSLPVTPSAGPAEESRSDVASRPRGAARVPRPRSVDDAVRLRTVRLSVAYGGVRAVDEVSIEVRDGEIVGLIGPNGAGKTSFVDGLTGFTDATGEIEFTGRRLDGMPPHGRARLGLVRTWQAGELFDDLSARENLRVASERASFGSFALDVLRPGRRIDQTAVDGALDLVGLSDAADARPRNLPLGRQKLLGVARALAGRPRVLLLDEPAAGLDSAESTRRGERLRDVVDDGVSILLIDHDMSLVLNTCDYIYVLEFGRMIAEGTPHEIRNDPLVLQAYLGESERAVADPGDLAVLP